MKILILGGSNSRNSGGVFETARTLGANLNMFLKADVQFMMYDDEYSLEDRKYYEPLQLHSYSVTGPKNLGFSLDLFSKIRKVQPDIIHTQSIWMYLSYVNRRYNLKSGTPYIISPHGMLDAWQLRQSVFKKKMALALYEMKHLQKANCIQALCQNEYDAIRRIGLKAPVAIIPNGIDLPLININKDYSKCDRQERQGNRKTLLFLSRIHPKKGLEFLLKAWAITRPKEHNWKLVIAGETKDKQYMKLLIDLANSLKITDTVSFIGGQFGNNKETCYQDACAFILPSFSEGLPMAVLEAWSFKLPVIITPFCNLPEGINNGAGILINPSVEDISLGIQKLLNFTEDELSVMGLNGYNLVKEKFSWEYVAQSMFNTYKWILDQKEKPKFVFNY